MESNSPESKPPQSGSLQSMLARLRGMVQALKATDQEGEELLPTWDATASTPIAPAERLSSATAAAEKGAQPAELADASGAAPAVVREDIPAPQQAVPPVCPYCQAPRTGQEPYCADCGWIFAAPAAAEPTKSDDDARPRLHDRYEIGARICERGPVVRYHGLDHGAGDGGPVGVIILRSTAATLATAEPSPAELVENQASGEALPQSGELPPALPQAEAVPLEPVWPSIAWERALLEKLRHPALPRVLDAFAEDGFEYLVEELPVGQLLWDAWDDPAASADHRFAWLKQIAGVLFHFYENNALLEAFPPEMIVMTPDGQPRFTDLSDLLPLPLPPNPPIRATYYTAPELVLANDKVDARAAIYSFGAMLYALHLGRELTELDFELHGVPKPFLERFPDAHPLFGRLVSKTFCRNLNDRFPTEDGARADASGFSELVRTLEDCRNTLDAVRLEIAAWTTTGMVRSGNEDAFALLHAALGRENRLEEAALVLLADGMGGYEAGEVAAALAIRALRNNLLKQKPFAAFGGESLLSSDHEEQQDTPAHTENGPFPVDVETCKTLLAAALQDANRQVYSAARSGLGSEGMGCTVEVVYVDGRHVVVGHVGDSRTYHLHEGRLIQLTQDQTWVHRMVELGAMTAQEALEHPRRSELQQAIGGRADVEPALYDRRLKPGDWVVVCSDGLTNHTAPDTLKEMLQSAPSAEWAARRLVNSVNLAGATDNATVVVIRAT
jgi:serine/threonine protein phosphatase PrpC